MAEVKVVIAKYRENLEWVSELGYDYIVYDKSSDPCPGAVLLPNVGRESHTYLTHIVRHYDDLDPVTVFVQGDPFDHLDDQGQGDVAMLRKMIKETAEKRMPFKGLAWFKLKCDRLGRPHSLHKKENEGRWAGWGKDIPLGEIFEKLFEASFPEELLVRAPAGLFMVTAERIRTRPRAFYEYALKLIEDDPDDAQNTGHAFERLWQHIFNGNIRWNKASYEN